VVDALKTLARLVSNRMKYMHFGSIVSCEERGVGTYERKNGVCQQSLRFFFGFPHSFQL
jgi:hypothetical protein